MRHGSTWNMATSCVFITRAREGYWHIHLLLCVVEKSVSGGSGPHWWTCSIEPRDSPPSLQTQIRTVFIRWIEFNANIVASQPLDEYDIEQYRKPTEYITNEGNNVSFLRQATKLSLSLSVKCRDVVVHLWARVAGQPLLNQLDVGGPTGLTDMMITHFMAFWTLRYLNWIWRFNT